MNSFLGSKIFFFVVAITLIYLYNYACDLFLFWSFWAFYCIIYYYLRIFPIPKSFLLVQSKFLAFLSKNPNETL